MSAQTKLRKPEAILFDLSTATAKHWFVEKTLLPYARNYTKYFLEENWDRASVQEAIERLRAEPSSEPDAPKISKPLSRSGPESGSKSQSGSEHGPKQKCDKSVSTATATEDEKTEIINNVINYVNYCADNKRAQTDAYMALRLLVWFDGYAKGRLETPVYSDVALRIQKWRCDDQISIYAWSDSWTSAAARRFLARTNHGDLNLLITDHFDAPTMGPAHEPATYRRILARTRFEPQNLLFLTRFAAKAYAASAAGIRAVIIETKTPSATAATATASVASDKIFTSDKDLPRSTRNDNDNDHIDHDKNRKRKKSTAAASATRTSMIRSLNELEFEN